MVKATPYRTLCYLLIVLYFGHSVSFSFPKAELFADVLSTILLVGLTYFTLQQSKKRLMIVAISILVAACLWIDWSPLTISTRAIALSILFVFELFCVGIILKDILSNTAVSSDDIFGCIASYLLVGFAMAALFEVVDLVTGGSFVFSFPTSKTFSSYLYLSFMNLTTLGYGDVIPTNDFSRALCVLEAAFGQIYLAVVIAHLIGFHLHKKISRNSKYPHFKIF